MLAVLATHPAPSIGQTSVFFRVGADTVRAAVRLDSLGVHPPPGVDRPELEAYLANQGFSFADENVMASGTLVVGVAQPFSSIGDALARGRFLYLDRPDLIENAGPLARPVGHSIPFVVVDQIIVQYHAGTGTSDRVSLEIAHDLEALAVSPTDSDLILYRVASGTPRGYFDTVEQLSQSALTDWAYPDYVGGAVNAEFIPDDSLFSSQWHLKNGGGAVGDINATLAWDVTLGSADVSLAIVEIGGFETNHPDLLPKLWANATELGGTAGVDDDGNGLVDDINGWNFSGCVNAMPCGGSDLAGYYTWHGTPVAGLAAAAGNNVRGVSGVCIRCRLMLLPMGGAQWGRIHALRYARDHGAAAINGSWGAFYDALVAAEITDIVQNHEIPVVLASGNDTVDTCSGVPSLATVPEAFTVGATNRADLHITASNVGSCLELVAPGGANDDIVGIATTDAQGNSFYNALVSHADCSPDFANLDYSRCFGGTSAAVPQVVGTIGLMLSVNPGLEPPEIYQILIETAEKVSCADALYGGSATCPTTWNAHSTKYGYGRLDAFAAVERALALTACEECSCDCGDCPDPSCPEEEPSALFELGARAGWTDVRGAGGEEAASGPGSGAAAQATFHLTWLPGGNSTSWLLELQLGWDFRSQGSTDTSSLVAAIQPAYVFTLLGAEWYLGPNFAGQRVDDGTVTTTDTALGLAFGRRLRPLSHLSVHLEGRYRHWSSRSWDELGVSLGFGVRIP